MDSSRWFKDLMHTGEIDHQSANSSPVPYNFISGIPTKIARELVNVCDDPSQSKCFALFEIFDQSDNFIAGFTTNIFSYAYVAYNFNSYWIKSIIWTIDFGRVFSRDSIDFHNVIRMISTKNRCHELTEQF